MNRSKGSVQQDGVGASADASRRQQPAQPSSTAAAAQQDRGPVQHTSTPSAGLSSNDTADIIDLFSDEDDVQPGAAGRGSSDRQPSAAGPRQVKPRFQLGLASRPGGNARDGGVGSSAASSSDAGASNPFWQPARYMPQGGEMQQDMTLRTNMMVSVLDAGLQPHPCRACLDTGTLCRCGVPCVQISTLLSSSMRVGR